jgi:hypothetical protein
MAEIIWLFDKHGRKITTERGRIEAARDFARHAALQEAANNAAALRPYKGEGAQSPIDTRLCAATELHGLYLVLQFSEGVNIRNLSRAAPVDVWHVRPEDFRERFAIEKRLAFGGAFYDQFHRHIFSNSQGVGKSVILCAQKIAAVHEVSKAGIWKPAQETAMTVDETGWRPIDRSLPLARGDLLIEYVGGLYAGGPAAQMRRRLLPRAEQNGPSPKI